jgi:hypothetical protein
MQMLRRLLLVHGNELPDRTGSTKEDATWLNSADRDPFSCSAVQ